MKTAVFLVALVAISVRASPLEGRPLKDDAEDYSIGFAADYDMSGDEEEWGEFLERGEPSEFYLQEVREQLENRTAPQTQPLTRYRRDCEDRAEISHGHTIGVQSVAHSVYWLSSYRSTYERRSCPGWYITEADKNTCDDERFTIYRASGPGIVRTDDLIGIYSQRRSSWLGCAGSPCRRDYCPGTPSTTYGFQDIERWYRCYGAVFKIYARGKGIGEAIEEHDHVLLFHLQRQQWFSMYVDTVRVLSCVITARPPPIEYYDWCGAHSFEIWIR